jgi:hypothetical protein
LRLQRHPRKHARDKKQFPHPAGGERRTGNGEWRREV